LGNVTGKTMDNYEGRSKLITDLVAVLELSARVRTLDDAREREAVALADGLFDLAEVFQRFIDRLLPNLQHQTDELGVDDALDDILSDFKEVVWHLWYSKFLRSDLLGPDVHGLPWIAEDLRP
jgi:hypothetical protein